MANNTVDVFVFFVNGATPNTNIRRIIQDMKKTNSEWEECIIFVLKGIYFSKSNLIVKANSISAKEVFKNRKIESLFKRARKTTGQQSGIYVFYIAGNYLDEGSGRKIVGAGGTHYELFGRVLLTDKADGRFTMAHEFGHVLLKRYDNKRKRFIHDDPTGPYIHYKKRIKDRAHSNDPNNLMFPISPVANPEISTMQCKIAKQSKIVKSQNNGNENGDSKIKFF